MQAFFIFPVLGILLFLSLALCFVMALILFDIIRGTFRILRGETWSPFVPARGETIETIVKALDVSRGAIVYELGCGDARVLAACARAQPDATYIGIEGDLLPYVWACLRAMRYPNMHIQKGNLFDADLHNATHIFTYLLPTVMRELEPKLTRELRAGARLVSLDYELPNTKPVLVTEFKTKKRLGKRLLIYRWS